MDDIQNQDSSQSYGGYQETSETPHVSSGNLNHDTSANPLGQSTSYTPHYTPHSSFIPSDQTEESSTPPFVAQTNSSTYQQTAPSATPNAMSQTPGYGTTEQGSVQSPPAHHSTAATPMDALPLQQTPTPNYATATPPLAASSMQDSTTLPPAPPNKRKMPKALFAVLLILFVLVGLTLTTGVLIAYEKIPVSNAALQHQIARMVFKIPFVPETPKFVLVESLAAQKDVTSGHTDASFAIQGTGIPSFLTSVPMEMSLSGDYDYSDLENPKSDFTMNFANQLEMNVLTLDNTYYFRLTKIPTVLLAYMGLSDDASFSELQNKWVMFDSTTLNTDAKETLMAESEEDRQELTEKYERIAFAVLEEDLLPHMSLSNDSLDGASMHKLTMEMNGEEFNELVKQATIHMTKLAHEEGLIDELPDDLENEFDTTSTISEIETVRFSLWVDQSTYYISKGEFYMKSNYDESLAALSPDTFGAVPSTDDGEKISIEIVASARFSKQGEPVEITKPTDAVSIEEYMEIVSQAFGFDAGSLLGIEPEFSDAKSTVQLISTSTNVFYATEGEYPLTISELASTNLSNVALYDNYTAHKVKYNISKDSEAYIIYSTVEDPNNIEAPYYVIVGDTSGSSSIQNMSAEDLNTLLISLGLPTDSSLGLPSSGAPSLPNLIY